MALAAAPDRFQPVFFLKIETRAAFDKRKRFVSSSHFTSPCKIEADLQPARVKASRPVEVALAGEIMPFDAITKILKAPVHLAPAPAGFGPGGAFRKNRSWPSFQLICIHIPENRSISRRFCRSEGKACLSSARGLHACRPTFAAR